MEQIFYLYIGILIAIAGLVLATLLNWQCLTFLIYLKNPDYPSLSSDERADLFDRERLLNSESSLEKMFANIDRVLSRYCGAIFIPLFSSLPKLLGIFTVGLVLWFLSDANI